MRGGVAWMAVVPVSSAVTRVAGPDVGVNEKTPGVPAVHAHGELGIVSFAESVTTQAACSVSPIAVIVGNVLGLNAAVLGIRCTVRLTLPVLALATACTLPDPSATAVASVIVSGPAATVHAPVAVDDQANVVVGMANPPASLAVAPKRSVSPTQCSERGAPGATTRVPTSLRTPSGIVSATVRPRRT